MSDLENLNIPIIGCLMQDITVPLGSDQQRSIAKWAVKTSMVQDAIIARKRELFFTKSERLTLRINTGFPLYTRVWLGRSSLSKLTASGTDHIGDINDGTKILGIVNGCVHTFVVGRLVLEVATIHAPDKYNGRAFDVTPQVLGPWDDLLIPIWPIDKAVNWPPPLMLKGQRGISKLADRFNAGSPTVTWS